MAEHRLLAATALVGMAAGCAGPQRTYTAAACVVGVRYDVEPIFVCRTTDEAKGIIMADFEAVAGLGFTDLVLHHVDPADRAYVLQAAADTGLNAIFAAVPGGTASLGAGTVPSAAPSPADAGARLETWLAAYHTGLIRGRTAGIIVDRYRSLPGDPPGLSAERPDGRLALTAAVKELATRAALWGRRLAGSRLHAVIDAPQGNETLRLAVFARDRRRYLLVFNASSSEYVRDAVTVPASAVGLPLRRAVEVPASSDRPAGHVTEARGDRLALSVALRPGDAALFELF